MIILKLYASVVAVLFLAGIAQMLYGICTNNIQVGDRGLACWAGALALTLLGAVTTGLSFVWGS